MCELTKSASRILRVVSVILFSLYRSIPITAEDNYLLDTLDTFVHTSNAFNPEPRRDIADELREWSLTTRATNPDYWLFHVYLPLVLK